MTTRKYKVKDVDMVIAVSNAKLKQESALFRPKIISCLLKLFSARRKLPYYLGKFISACGSVINAAKIKILFREKVKKQKLCAFASLRGTKQSYQANRQSLSM